jgi:hypothetical protein
MSRISRPYLQRNTSGTCFPDIAFDVHRTPKDLEGAKDLEITDRRIKSALVVILGKIDHWLERVARHEAAIANAWMQELETVSLQLIVALVRTRQPGHADFFKSAGPIFVSRSQLQYGRPLPSRARMPSANAAKYSVRHREYRGP